jgi:chromate transporter
MGAGEECTSRRHRPRIVDALRRRPHPVLGPIAFWNISKTWITPLHGTAHALSLRAKRGNDRKDPACTPLIDLFLVFLGVGALSFGGGLAAWIRRETVQRRGWLDDRQFLAGYAVSQIVPGATNVNLAVFIGAQLRGLIGAAVAVIGLMAIPVGFVMAAGALYAAGRGGPAAVPIARALAGMGAAAIGLNLATGIRLGRSNLRTPRAVLVAAITAVAVGLLNVPLLYALAAMIPISFLLTWRGQPQ